VDRQGVALGVLMAGGAAAIGGDAVGGNAETVAVTADAMLIGVVLIGTLFMDLGSTSAADTPVKVFLGLALASLVVAVTIEDSAGLIATIAVLAAGTLLSLAGLAAYEIRRLRRLRGSK
jgi:hypothetical protein